MIIMLFPSKWIEKLVGEEKSYAYNLLLSSISVLILLIFYYYVMDGVSNGGDNPISSCIFLRITRYPCIGCGISRSIFSLFDCDLKMSFDYNPMGTVFILSIVMQIPLQILVVCDKVKQLTALRISRTVSIVTVIGLVIVWGYQLVQLL